MRRVPIGLVLFQVAAAHACASIRELRVGRHGPRHSTTATTAQLDDQNLFFSQLGGGGGGGGGDW